MLERSRRGWYSRLFLGFIANLCSCRFGVGSSTKRKQSRSHGGTDGGANGGADGGAMDEKDGVGNGGVGAKEGAETFSIGEVENATIEGEQTGVDLELFVDTKVVLIVDVDLIADELEVEDGTSNEPEDLCTAMRRGRSGSGSVWSSRRSI